MAAIGLYIPLPAHLGIKFICVRTHLNVWQTGFLDGAMDHELDTSPWRRVYDSGFLVAAEGLSLWSLAIIYEELLLAGFCANVQLGLPVLVGDFFSFLFQRIVDSADSRPFAIFRLPTLDSSKFHGHIHLKFLRHRYSLVISWGRELGNSKHWEIQTVWLQTLLNLYAAARAILLEDG